MEREALSEGSRESVGNIAGDLQKLGNRTPEATPAIQDSTIAIDGAKPRRNPAAVAAEKRYRLRNKERRNAESAEYRKNNPEKVKAIAADWRARNKCRTNEYSKKFYAKNRERRLAEAKASRERNKEKISARNKIRYQKNRQRNLAYLAGWRSRNREKMKADAKAYLPRRMELRRLRRANDPVQRIKDACRTRVSWILKCAGIPKHDHTFELVGCAPDFLKSYLEAHFAPGMSWDNYGEWEIDHVIPIASFNISDRSQRLLAFNYSNCKPLWKPDNRSKNDSLPGPHKPNLI